MATWQADGAAAAGALAPPQQGVSPQQQQQQQMWGGLQVPLSPAGRSVAAMSSVPGTPEVASPDKQLAGIASTHAALTSPAGAYSAVVQREAAAPQEVLQQLATLESQLLSMKQQLLQGPEQQPAMQDASASLAAAVAALQQQQSMQQQQQLSEVQALLPSQQLAQLQGSLQGLLPGSVMHATTLSAAQAEQQQQPAVPDTGEGVMRSLASSFTGAQSATAGAPGHITPAQQPLQQQQQQPSPAYSATPRQQLRQQEHSPAAEQQQQQQQPAATAGLQLELLQASAEAQLVMTQQVNELHNELGAATADIQAVQDQLQQLAAQQHVLQQQLDQQQGVMQGEQLQQLNQQLQQVQMQLQQLQGSGLTAEQQMLQEQLQLLQHQQDSTAKRLEAQAAAAVAAAAAETAQQLEVLKQQIAQIDRSQQEMLQGSHARIIDSALRDDEAQNRLTVVEGQLMQQQEAVEVLRKQLAELQQQQGAAAGVGQDGLQQQQQQLAGEVDNIKQQLSQLQQEKQQQQLVHEAALAAAGESGTQAGAAAATEAAAALREQVQQLELKVAQLQVQQAQDTPAAAAAAAADQSSRVVAELGASLQQQMRAELAGEVMALQQQLQNLNSSVEQLQGDAAASGASNASPGQHADAAASAGAAAAAAECGALQQQLLRLDQRVADMAGQLQECSNVAGITLPLRMSEVEERVAATAQTCADAVKVRTAASCMMCCAIVHDM
jgi:hypothetical protein